MFMIQINVSKKFSSKFSKLMDFIAIVIVLNIFIYNATKIQCLDFLDKVEWTCDTNEANLNPPYIWVNIEQTHTDLDFMMNWRFMNEFRPHFSCTFLLYIQNGVFCYYVLF